MTYQNPKPQKSSLTNLLTKDISFKRSLSIKSKQFLYSQLSSYLNGGLNLVKSLELVSGSKILTRNIAEVILPSLIKGMPFWGALSESKMVSEFEVAMIQFGEESGKLSKVAEELASYYENIEKQRKKIVQALTYPFVILITAFVAVFFLIKFVVPIFEDVFKQFGGELPAITKFVLRLSTSFNQILFWAFFSILAVTLIFWKLMQSPKIRLTIGRLTFSIPFIGYLIKDLNNKKLFFCLQLGTNSGLPLNVSIQQTTSIVSSLFIKNKLDMLLHDLFEGMSFTQAVKNSKLLTKVEVSLIQAGEEIGNLDLAFNQIVHSIDRRESARISALNNFLEPLLIIFIGGLIGVVLISMYLPMFEISNIIK